MALHALQMPGNFDGPGNKQLQGEPFFSDDEGKGYQLCVC